MKALVTDKIFSGKFPAYSYMYTIRQFMRINSVCKKAVDDFVKSVSGKNLSIREIETLANGYFKGSDEIRSQIKDGNISWGLDRAKESSKGISDCTGIEQKMLKDLEIAQKYMQRVIYKSRDERFKTQSFHAQANLLTGGILRQINKFNDAMRMLNDRTGQKTSNILPS